MLFDVMRWLLAVELIGAAALPLTSRLFAQWPDRGLALSKILGLVLVGHAVWLTSILGLTGFSGATILGFAVVLALLGGRLGSTRQGPRNWALCASEEAVFLAMFAAAVAIRAASPAIAGQEKPMDLTFLQSLIRADVLPAQDAWLAGWGLPYYYFGYLLWSLPAKVVGIDPVVAYNLAVATVPALAAAAAFGIVTSLIAGRGPRWPLAAMWGAVAAFALTIMGNLQAFAEVGLNRGWGDRAFWLGLGIKNLGAAPSDGWFPADGAWWFRAARVIPNIEPDGITEFPFFSFLLADLHPHFMAMPLVLLIVGLALHQLTSAPLETESRFTRAAQLWAPAIALGAVISTNTWDVPLLWGAYGLGVLGAAVQSGKGRAEVLRSSSLRLAAILGLGIAAFAPYFVGYASQPLGLGLVTERTLLGSLLILFGPLLVLPAVGGLTLLAAERGAAGGGRPPVGFLVGVASAVVLVALREPTLAALVALLAIWGQVLVWRVQRQVSPTRLATAGLSLLGLAAILVPELIFLRDVFGSRMNTVFKFYYDAWILLALAFPLIAWEVASLVRPATVGVPLVFRGAALGSLSLAGALAVAGALYPIGATPARSQAFGAVPTLDGMAHLRAQRPDDAAAIEWLRSTSPGAGVVEAVGDDYSDAGRFATFGGSVAPLGWIGHELQWRGPRPELEARRDLVRRTYTEPLDSAAQRVLGQLGMDFIAVGTLERQLYGADVESRFAVLEPAFQAGGTTLYRLAPRTIP